MLCTLLFTTVSLALLACFRIFQILPQSKALRKSHISSGYRTLAVFLGSGGHTSEVLTLISALDFERYSPRIYFVSEGDHLSVGKAKSLELTKSLTPSQENFSVFTIPRARNVHQSLFTTPPTALRSLFACVNILTIKPLLDTHARTLSPDILILNGPGTCLVLCLAVYVHKFFGFRAPRIVYVESFARVRSLSLSGKLLRPLVDRFIVQWPELLGSSGKGEYHGWLV